MECEWEVIWGGRSDRQAYCSAPGEGARLFLAWAWQGAVPRGGQGWRPGMTAVEQEEWFHSDHEKRVRNTALMLVEREEVKSRPWRCKEGYHKKRAAELNVSTEHPPSLAGTLTLNWLEFCPTWQQCLPLTSTEAPSLLREWGATESQYPERSL